MRMQGKTKHIYAEAERDIRKKLDDFLARFKAEDERRKKLVDAGEMSKAEYDSWRRGQIFRGKRWQALRDEIVDQIYGSNKTATRIMNDERRSVFIQNANRTAYELEKKTHGAVSFELYDSATVTRLMKKDRKLLPYAEIKKMKDGKYNRKKVNNALTQSIIQGESMDKLSGRIAEAVSSKNASLMYSFARTMMTGAQNAGRLEAMREARDMGIKLKKRWLATLDSRTRDTHRDLDGVSVDVDKPFIIDDGMEIREIMFPGDPNADADLVANCRCTLIYDYEDYPANIQRRDNETGEVIDYMTYREWEQWKTEQVKPEAVAAILPRHMDFVPAESIKEAEEQAKSYLSDGGKASYRGLSLDAANACNRVLGDVGATFNVPGLDSIQPMNMRSNAFKNSTAEAAYRWGMHGSLFINPTFYKSASALAAHKAEIDGLMSTVMNGGQALIDSGRVTGKKRDYIEALLRTGRQCVSQSHDFLEGTIAHECGHRLDDQIFRKALIEAFGVDRVKYADRLAESRRQYGGGISGYAIADNAEYMAESFTAWWYGESSIIDPIIKGVFEKLVKK